MPEVHEFGVLALGFIRRVKVDHGEVIGTIPWTTIALTTPAIWSNPPHMISQHQEARYQVEDRYFVMRAREFPKPVSCPAIPLLSWPPSAVPTTWDSTHPEELDLGITSGGSSDPISIRGSRRLADGIEVHPVVQTDVPQRGRVLLSDLCKSVD